MTAPGAYPKARLVSTMIDVLVAESAEPGRLRRGRQYARQGAVAGLRVEPGLVAADIQGSTPHPYVATARVNLTGGDTSKLTSLVPSRREVRYSCTCPDDDAPCKHAVALMAAFSERLAYDVGLFLRWRTGRDDGASAGDAHGSPAEASSGPAVTWTAAETTFTAAALAEIRAVLGTDGPHPPPVPDLPPLAPPRAAWDEVWAEMLTHALETLRRPTPPTRRR